MSAKYKVVYGSCACGFKDVSGPQSYTDSLDIVNAETGRLMSWVL